MTKLNHYFFQGFILGFYFWVDVVAHNEYAIVLERAEGIIGGNDDIVDFSQLKITRKGPNYLFNGNVTYRRDMDNSFSYKASSAASPYRNNHFIQQPYKLDPTAMCVFHNTTFKKYVHSSLSGHSNYPEIPPEGLCPIPKGTFYLKDVFIEDSNLPPYLPRGLWRIELMCLKDNTFVGGLRVFASIIDKK